MCSLSLRERARVREKSMITPLTLTLSPEVRGGEGTGAGVLWPYVQARDV
jgi:hypothetical protein